MQDFNVFLDNSPMSNNKRSLNLTENQENSSLGAYWSQATFCPSSVATPTPPPHRTEIFISDLK